MSHLFYLIHMLILFFFLFEPFPSPWWTPTLASSRWAMEAQLFLYRVSLHFMWMIGSRNTQLENRQCRSLERKAGCIHVVYISIHSDTGDIQWYTLYIQQKWAQTTLLNFSLVLYRNGAKCPSLFGYYLGKISKLVKLPNIIVKNIYTLK